MRATVVGAGLMALNPRSFSRALAGTCSASGPYGALGPADHNGIRLPAGFVSRVVARSGSNVPGTQHVWHSAPDGGATFSLSDGGWAYVSNSEVDSNGGAGSIRFRSDGSIAGAARILSRTNRNCAGGPTPWGTWLSCEEVGKGRVFECHPLNRTPAVARLALGRFKHEAAAVDGAAQTVYLTEDERDGRFYRFRYPIPDNLSTGTLEVAAVDRRGFVTWLPVPDPAATLTATRYQVPWSTGFNRGEGAWYGKGVVHLTTSGDNRVWAYDVRTQLIRVVYAPGTSCNPVLTGVDNVVASTSGDLYVAEDGGDMQLVILAPDGSVSPFLQIMYQDGSEITGPAFAPRGDRLYLSSQRGGSLGRGITYEIRGPFRSLA